MREYNSEFCNVIALPERDAVMLTWKKFACSKEYREPTTYAWKLFEETNASIYLVDARNGFEDELADVEWGFTVLLPGMAKTSCKTVCFILNEVNEIEKEMDLWTKEFSKYFTVIKGTSVDEVLAKIK